jgi:spore coat protein U-like protein
VQRDDGSKGIGKHKMKAWPTRFAAVLAGALLLAAAVPVAASSLGVRMEVTATVVPNCRLSVPPLSFGAYDPLDGNSVDPADATTVITVNCTRSTGAAVSFDLGLNPASDVARAMSGPATERLQYQIYRDAARSLVWSQGENAVRVVSRGITTADSLTVFGRIPPRQEVAPGAYSDLLTATVDF